MAFNNGPKLVTQGLNLLVDAGDPTSYPGSGTTWRDVVGGQNGTITGSVSYSSAFYGGLVFSGPTASVIFPTSSANFGTSSFTVELAFRPERIQGIHYLISKNSGSFPSWGIYLSGSGGSGKLFSEFRISSTVSCSVSSSTTFVTGSNYQVDVKIVPSVSVLGICVNGQTETSNLGNGAGTLTSTGSLLIGNTAQSSSQSFSGSIYNTKAYTFSSLTQPPQNYNAIRSRLSLPARIFTQTTTPLLDTYPNAYTAFSLRLLRTAYNGSAIRVRRSSDNAETDIGFDSLGNLNITALLGHCGNGNGFITTWYDQSGNGRNATQATTGNQPRIVNAGVVEVSNGKPAIRNFQATSTSLSFAGSSSTKSVFIVLEYLSNPAGDYPFWVGGTDYHGDVTNWLATFAATSVKNGSNKINGVTTDLVTTPRTLNQKLISMIHQTTATLSSIGLGNIANRNWEGYFNELIIYTSDQTSNVPDIEKSILFAYNNM